MKLLCFLTLSWKCHSIILPCSIGHTNHSCYKCVCVLVADVCVCGRGWCCYTKCPEVGIMATTSSKNYTIFAFISQSAMPADSFHPSNSVSDPGQPAQPFPPLCHPRPELPRSAPFLCCPLSRPWSSWGAVSRAVLCWEDGPEESLYLSPFQVSDY